MDLRTISFPLQLTPLGIAVFLCGAVSWHKIIGLGELFTTELLLPLIAFMAILTLSKEARRIPRTLFVFIGLGVLMLCGYVLADVISGTDASKYLRGWARILALISNFTCLSIVFLRDRRTIWWFTLGAAFGGFLHLFVAGIPLSTWKFGYGNHALGALACISGFFPVWVGMCLFLIAGLASVYFDSRSLGAFAMVAAVAVVVGSRHGKKAARNLRTYLVVASVFVTVLAILYGGLVGTQNEYSQRRGLSNLERFAALQVGVEAILDNPIVGYGSWGQGTEQYARRMYEETAWGAAELGVYTSEGRIFSPHSQILQGWIEGGFLAVFFFVFFGVQLIRQLYNLLLRRPLDFLTPVFALALSAALWDLLMSPFAGQHRLDMAMAIAVLIVMCSEYRPNRPARPTAHFKN